MTDAPTRNVLTLVGPDKPGIIEVISGTLSGQGFNIEDSRMSILGGEFAMILLVSGPSSAAHLIPEMEEASGMTIQCRDTRPKPETPPGVPYLVYGYSMDHPGIVHALARELALLGANIEEMDTSLQPAPVTGTPLFDVRMRVSLPPSVQVNVVKNRLEEIGDAQNIDVSVEPFSH